MGIFSRLTDIVNSNISSLLDKAEDPQKMIRLIINEMEETLVEVRSSSAKVISDKKEVFRRLQSLKDEAFDWGEKAKLAITKKREDLAKGALLERQSLNEEVTIVEEELMTLDQHLNGLSEEVAILQKKIDEARARQKTMLMRAKTVENRIKVKRQVQKNYVQNAFNKLEGFERRMDNLEGELESLDIGQDKDLKAEFAQMENDEKIQAELDALKAELSETKEK